MNNKLHFSSAKTGVKQQDKWETPTAVFEQINDEFNFTLDAAAETETTLCEYYFTEEDNAPSQDWNNQVAFCNPHIQN